MTKGVPNGPRTLLRDLSPRQAPAANVRFARKADVSLKALPPAAARSQACSLFLSRKPPATSGQSG